MRPRVRLPHTISRELTDKQTDAIGPTPPYVVQEYAGVPGKLMLPMRE